MGRFAPIQTALALAAAAAVASGCGDDKSEGKTVTVDGAQPVPVVAKEYSFDPKTIVVDRPSASKASLDLKLENEGELAHDLKVGDAGATPVITGGKSADLKLDLEPGTYDFICTVGDHEQLGMKGKIEVR